MTAMLGRLSGDGEFGDFVDKYLRPVSITGREVMCICVFHDDTNASMQFNLDKGLFVCFACGVGGSYRKIEKQLGVDHRNVEVGLDVIYRKLNDLRRSNGDTEGPRILSESVLEQYAIDSEHWAERKLNAHTIEAFDLGYDIGHDAMTIPVRNMSGDLIGITRRYCDPDADPRYRYPKGFHKGEHLFASWMVAADPSATSVALTEGAIDAMTLWQFGVPAMAIYGSFVTEAQIRIMRMLSLTKVVLFFDNDRAGSDITSRCRGWKKDGPNGWKKAPELDLRRYFDCYTVDWTGTPKSTAKDANDLGILKARNMYSAARALG